MSREATHNNTRGLLSLFYSLNVFLERRVEGKLTKVGPCLLKIHYKAEFFLMQPWHFLTNQTRQIFPEALERIILHPQRYSSIN